MAARLPSFSTRTYASPRLAGRLHRGHDPGQLGLIIQQLRIARLRARDRHQQPQRAPDLMRRGHVPSPLISRYTATLRCSTSGLPSPSRHLPGRLRDLQRLPGQIGQRPPRPPAGPAPAPRSAAPPRPTRAASAAPTGPARKSALSRRPTSTSAASPSPGPAPGSGCARRHASSPTASAVHRRSPRGRWDTRSSPAASDTSCRRHAQHHRQRPRRPETRSPPGPAGHCTAPPWQAGPPPGRPCRYRTSSPSRA